MTEESLKINLISHSNIVCAISLDYDKTCGFRDVFCDNPLLVCLVNSVYF